MKLARVIGNVVSTIRSETHEKYKLMVVQYLDGKGVPSGPHYVAFDCGEAGVGDLVIVNTDGGAAKLLLDDKDIVANQTICGVVDSYTYNS
ncbi:MAG: EutN/CcmL family microcompartment protein [Treponema sp.]|nr:EutN/CcmL family microcompartment protein [Treponema sp.]